MKKVLLLSVTDIVNGSVIEDNVDTKLLAKTIGIAQETGLKSILGVDLYNGLIDAVYNHSVSGTPISTAYSNLIEVAKPYLLSKTVADFIVINNYKVSNKGLVKLNDNSATALSDSDLENVKNYYNNLVSTYKSTLVQFLKDSNLIDYNNDVEITSESTGWYFGNTIDSSKQIKEEIPSIADYVAPSNEQYTYQQLSMLRNVLLISSSDIISNSVIEDTVDVKLLSRTIQTVQEVYLKAILSENIYFDTVYAVYLNKISGTTLSNFYGDLLTLIKPYMVNKVVAEFIIPNNYKFTTKGLLKLNDTSATALSDSDLENVKNHYDNISTTYKIDIINFLKKYNLLDNNSDTDITSDATGWFMSDIKPSSNATATFLPAIYTDKDRYITGASYSNGVLTLTSNSGDTVIATGFFTGSTDTYVTGGTYSNGTASFRNNAGGTFIVTGLYTGSTGAYLPLSGGTMSGDILFSGANTINIGNSTAYAAKVWTSRIGNNTGQIFFEDGNSTARLTSGRLELGTRGLFTSGNNAADIGENTNQFRTGYFGTTLFTPQVNFNTTPTAYIQGTTGGTLSIYSNSGYGVPVKLNDILEVYYAVIQAKANLTFQPDNTYDIGTTGAGRPRNIYAGSGGYFNGTVTANTIGIGTVAPTEIFQVGTLNPVISLKQATSGAEYKIRLGLNTGLSNGSFNILDVTNNKVGMYMSGYNHIGFGNVTSIPNATQLYVYGGGNGANIDARPNPAVWDESNIECENSDYDGSTWTGYGIAMQHSGSGTSSTYFGYSSKQLSQLRFHATTNLIRVINNAALRFGTNDTERMVIGADGKIGIGLTAATNQLHVSAATNPVRFQGLQSASDSTVLTVDSSGTVHTILASTLTGGSGGTGTDTYVTGGTYTSGTTVFRNNTGGTFSVTGYSITIPRPMLEYKEHIGNSIGKPISFESPGHGIGEAPPVPRTNRLLTTHFLPCDTSWTNYHPRIFMFRYKRQRKTAKHSTKAQQSKAWVHPVDFAMNAAGVWNGSMFFGGKHMDSSSTEIANRRTEWLLGADPSDTEFTNSAPNELKAYNRKEIPLNLMQFWNDNGTFDTLPFPIAIGDIDESRPAIHITGTRKKGSTAWLDSRSGYKAPKTIYVRFAYAIDNPEWTSTNGKAPVIFGEFSDVLALYLKRSNNLGQYLYVSGRIGHSFAHVS